MLLLLGWVAGGGTFWLWLQSWGPQLLSEGSDGRREAAALKEDWWLSTARLSCCFSCDPPQACFPVAHCFILILTVLAC